MNKNKQTFLLIAMLISMTLFIGCILQLAPGTADPQGEPGIQAPPGGDPQDDPGAPPLGSATQVGSADDFGVGELYPYGLAAIGTTLYMVGGDFRSTTTPPTLYTVDTTTGIATRVGSADDFSVGEQFPYGLAAIGPTLYMVGAATEALYTVDTTTGIATQVGAADNFGIDVNTPRGLVAIGTTLYMVAYNSSALYTVDTTTGIATQVGNVTGFEVNEGHPGSLAFIDNTLYMTSGATLYTVDTTTRIATRIGDAFRFEVNELSSAGLAFIDNTLYMIGGWHDTLYTLKYQ